MNSRDSFLSDIIITATEGGTGYWAYASDYRWSEDHPETTTVTLTESEDYDPDDVLTFVITTADVERGIGLYLASLGENEWAVPFKVANLTNGEDGDYDAGDADCIVQFACFGEIVYG